MSRHIALDPEVEALLREVARQPRSALLRVARPTVLRPLDDREPLRSTEPFLSRAERHLIETRREELARLLAEMALWMRREDPSLNRATTTYQTATRKCDLRSTAALRERARSLADHPSVEPGITGLVRSLLRGPQFTSATALGLCQASLRLVPDHRVMILAAQTLLDCQQTDSSSLILHRVLASCPSPTSAALALESLGRTQYESRSFAEAMQSYSSASKLLSANCVVASCWLTNAALLGDAKQALEASEAVAGAIPEGHPFVDWYLALLARERRAERWSNEQADASDKLAQEAPLNSTAQRICHALA